MPKSQSQPTLTESVIIEQPGQRLLENFFTNLTQLKGLDAEVVKMLQNLYADEQISRDAILRKLAEMRRK